MSQVNLPFAGSKPAATDPSTRPGGTTGPTGVKVGQEDGFSFADLIDVINPLQHIPLLNQAYRSLTGDHIGAAAKIVGGTLFGGIPGLAAAVTDAVVETTTGKSTTGHLMAFVEEATDAASGDEYAAGTDVAEITGQTGGPDLEQLADDGGRWAVQVALADAATRRDSQIAATPSAPAPVPPPAQAPVARPIARGPQPFEAPTPMQPLLSRAVPANTRGIPTQLPSPQMLAANPALIDQARGPAAGNEAWMQLMNAAGENRGQGGGGLATATIAKAMASYGAAGAQMSPAAIAGAIKR